MAGPASTDDEPAESQRKASPQAAPGFQSGPDGFLYANGKRFHIKGLNWWGSEGVNAVPGGLHRRTVEELLDFVAEQGFNAIRLLVNHHSILVNGKVNAGEPPLGQRQTQLPPSSVLEPAVCRCI